MPIVNTTRSFDFDSYAALTNPFSLTNLPSVRQALEPMQAIVVKPSIYSLNSLKNIPSWQLALGAFALTGLVITILKKK